MVGPSPPESSCRGAPGPHIRGPHARPGLLAICLAGAQSARDQTIPCPSGREFPRRRWGFTRSLALARMWNAGERRRRGRAGAGLSVCMTGTLSGPPETGSSPHAQPSARLGDWTGSTAEDTGASASSCRARVGVPQPVCTPRRWRWPDSAPSGRGVPRFGGTQLIRFGAVLIGSGSQSGIPRNPTGGGGLPAPPVALGAWPVASLAHHPWKAGAFRLECGCHQVLR